MANEPTKPVHSVRYGAVSVAIWENQSVKGPFHNATVERTYRDDQGNPKASTSFGLADLALLQLAITDAAQWIAKARADQPPAPTGS